MNWVRTKSGFWILMTVLVCIIAACAIAIIATRTHHPAKKNGGVFSQTLLAQVTDFTPYEPTLMPANLHIDASSTSLQNNILFLKLVTADGQKSLTITEQSSPPGMANGDYKADKVDGVDGTAYLNHDQTRTFGTLFANGKNGKPTMVLVNTTDAFTTENFQDILRGFRAM